MKATRTLGFIVTISTFSLIVSSGQAAITTAFDDGSVVDSRVTERSTSDHAAATLVTWGNETLADASFDSASDLSNGNQFVDATMNVIAGISRPLNPNWGSRRSTSFREPLLAAIELDLWVTMPSGTLAGDAIRLDQGMNVTQLGMTRDNGSKAFHFAHPDERGYVESTFFGEIQTNSARGGTMSFAAPESSSLGLLPPLAVGSLAIARPTRR